jgi:TolB-like protein/tetratricopeptide (TPR) repeat protein
VLHNPTVTISRLVAAGTPSGDDIRAGLERILSSPGFQASQRRRAFLRFIVEETLSGRADRLKGYTIAAAVFGRDETFEAQADPVVRLEARRLRRDLDSYYIDAGSRDAMRISIPKGSYVPHFEWHEAAAPLAASVAGISHVAQRNLLIAALILAIVVISSVGWFTNAEKRQLASNEVERLPSIVVLPFQALNSTENSRHLANGIGQELLNNLTHFPGFRLYTSPATLEEDAGAEAAKLGRRLGVAYVVSGSVNTNANEIHVAVQTIEAKTGRVLWSQTYDRPLIPEALMRVQRELAGEIATVVGQPYGVVPSDLSERLETSAVSDMQSYVCVLRAYGYRRTFSRKEFEPVLRCLEDAVRRDPDYSSAWAMLAWLHLDAGRIPYAGYNTQDEYKKALQDASEAVRLAPKSILPLKVLGAVYHYMGRYDDSERIMHQALEINPYDPEALAQLGWRLAARGKFEEGIPLLKRAIARTVNPPGWYSHLIAVDLYLRRQYQQMREVVERGEPDNSGFSDLLIAIANGELGNRDATRTALKKLSEFKSLASDPAAYMRRHGAVDEIVNAIMAGLKKAREVASH